MDNGAQTLRKMMAQSGTGQSPMRAQACPCLGLAIGKVARQMFDVNASLQDLQSSELPMKKMLDEAPEPGLLVVIETSDGQKGLLTFDGLLINALVELMTGASERSVFKTPRVPTLIDTALCQDFGAVLLKSFPAELAKGSPQASLPKLGWSQTEVEAVKLAYILESGAMLRLSGQVSFQNGIRGGAISLALPVSVWAANAKKTGAKSGAGWSKTLTRNILATQLPLRANLEKIELPLARALALKTGDMLEISSFALSDLELATSNGQPLLHGRLGQENGKKAISISRSAQAINGPVLTLRGIKKTPGEGPAMAPKDEQAEALKTSDPIGIIHPG